MSNPLLTRPDDNADRRHHPSISLAHAQPRMSTRPGSNSSHDPVSAPMPTPPRAHRESAKLQLYDRYSQQMLVLACMFVGCVLVRNGAQNRPLTHLSPVSGPLHWRSMASTTNQRCEFRSWSLLSRPGSRSRLSSCPRCTSARSSSSNGSVPCHFLVRHYLTAVQLGTHETHSHVSRRIFGPLRPRVYRRLPGV